MTFNGSVCSSTESKNGLSKPAQAVNGTATAATTAPYKRQIVWRNVLLLGLVHGLALWGLTYLPYIQRGTLYFLAVIMNFGTLGVQAGAHRLWAHRAYKANTGVKVFLAIGHILSLQNDIYEWVRDHRAHHKWSDTDGDPHNAARGFFFSHMGWLMVKKHPDLIAKGKTLDMSDLEADPIVMFQRRYYIPLVLLFWGFLPYWIPVYFWNEDPLTSALVCVFFRYAYNLNLTWLVNSWSHMFGYRPYDKALAPVESTIRHLLMGEGFHNYHHAFPWDYSASELGAWDVFNPATAWINFFASKGWAWDLKKVDPQMIQQKMDAKGKKDYRYERGHGLYEWITGIASNFGLVFALRWAAIYGGQLARYLF